MSYSRFKIGGAVLFNGKRYTIEGPLWVDPFPGVMTWNIKRLIEHDEVIDIPKICSLEWYAENGSIEICRDESGVETGIRTQSYYAREDDLAGVDDPPTWETVDELRARVAELEAALQLKYRATGRKS